MFRSICIAICALAAFGCSDQLGDLAAVDEVRYRAEYALPLLDSELTLREFVGDDLTGVTLSAGPDDLLTLRYSGDVPEVGADVAFERLNSFSQGLLIPLLTERTAAPFALPNDVELDQANVSDGQVKYVLPNPYDRPVTITFSIPDATLDGQPLRVSGTLPAHDGEGDPPVLANADLPIALPGYTLRVPNDSIYLEYSITDTEGHELEVPAGNFVAIEDLRFDYAGGYLGQELYEGVRDTIAVNFFDAYREGDIQLVDPSVTIRLISSFGLPARAVIRRFDVTGLDGTVIPLTGEGVDDGFDFNYATTPGDTVVTNFVFNRRNSNIDAIINARPTALDYEINAAINPEANTDIRGFLTDSSAYQVEVDLDLPLYGNAHDFAAAATVDLNLGERYPNIEEAVLRLTTDNGFPVGLTLTGILEDSLGNALGTLSDGAVTLLEPAAIDAEGNPRGQRTATGDYRFSGDRLAQLRAAQRLAITVRLTSAEAGGPLVRIPDGATVRVRLGAIITVADE